MLTITRCISHIFIVKFSLQVKVMGLLELNSNNNEEIQREAISLRRSQFMRTLAKHYIFV